jgi:hypothetical protein
MEGSVQMLKLLLLLALLTPAWSQFRMKDSQATVRYGSSGWLSTCVVDNYGRPVNDAQVYAYVDPVQFGSGFHLHTEALGRPNIVFDGGGSSAGPKQTSAGCAYFHLTMPQYAGISYVTTYCTTCTNIAMNTFYVRGDIGTAAFTSFPSGGTLGIEPQYPQDLAFAFTADQDHGQLHKYGRPVLMQKLQAIGFYYYFNLGFPLGTNHLKWLQLLRVSLPWGGWYDDIGILFPTFWNPINPDPHGDGNQADFIYYGDDPVLGRAFVTAVAQAGCVQYMSRNYLSTDGGAVDIAYWHVNCF